MSMKPQSYVTIFTSVISAASRWWRSNRSWLISLRTTRSDTVSWSSVLTQMREWVNEHRLMMSVDRWSDSYSAARLWRGLHERQMCCCCWLWWCCDVIPHLGIQAQYAAGSWTPRGYWQTGHDSGNSSLLKLCCLPTVARYKLNAFSHLNYCRVIVILDFFAFHWLFE